MNHILSILIFITIYKSAVSEGKVNRHLTEKKAGISFNNNNRKVENLMSRVFANGLRDQGSIPGWVIPKTQKWYLMQPCIALLGKDQG